LGRLRRILAEEGLLKEGASLSSDEKEGLKVFHKAWDPEAERLVVNWLEDDLTPLMEGIVRLDVGGFGPHSEEARLTIEGATDRLKAELLLLYRKLYRRH
jgi:hypothetical protein